MSRSNQSEGIYIRRSFPSSISKVLSIQSCLAIIILFLLINYAYESLTYLSNNLYQIVQSKFFLQSISNVLGISFIRILPFSLLVLLFIVRIIVKPKMLQNFSNMYFITFSVCTLQTLKLLFGEYKPFMFEAVINRMLVPIVQELDFGFPCGSVFMMICIGQLYKVNFFRKIQKKPIINNIMESEFDFLQKFIKFEKTKMILTNCRYKIFDFQISLDLFYVIYFSLVFLASLSAIVSGLATIHQVFFSVILGFLWCYLYYYHLEMFLFKFTRDLVLLPQSRINSSFVFIILLMVWQTVNVLLYSLRKITANISEIQVIQVAIYNLRNPRGLALEDSAMYNSFIIFLPISMIFILFIFQKRLEIFYDEPAYTKFKELSIGKKIQRIFIILVLNSIPVGIVYGFDYFVRQALDLAYITRCFVFGFGMVIYSVNILLIQPFILLQLELLQPKEQLFLTSEKLKNKRKGKEEGEEKDKESSEQENKGEMKDEKVEERLVGEAEEKKEELEKKQKGDTKDDLMDFVKVEE